MYRAARFVIPLFIVLGLITWAMTAVVGRILAAQAADSKEAALLAVALKRRWVVQELDTRALTITRGGRRELLARFGLDLPLGSSSNFPRQRGNSFDGT